MAVSGIFDLGEIGELVDKIPNADDLVVLADRMEEIGSCEIAYYLRLSVEIKRRGWQAVNWQINCSNDPMGYTERLTVDFVRFHW